MGKVTIQSMAKDLGLSRNTVSLALKDSDLVSPQTREMVLRHAGRVGYIEYDPQKEIVKKTKQTLYHIMILRKKDQAVYWDKVINGIAEEASKNNCLTQVAVVTEEEEITGQFPLGLDESIDAVFCVRPLNWNYMKKIKDYGYHLFVLDDYQSQQLETLGDVVRSEGVDSVACLTQHLIDQGMTRIGFLNENSDVLTTMHDRYMGYLLAMEQAGIPLEPGLVKPNMNDPHFYWPSSFDVLVQQYEELPEAIVCGNDRIAILLTQAFRKIGVRVPEDVALTGFDDDEDKMMDPFFSTVHIDVKWLGRRMLQSFLWRMQNLDAPYEEIVISGEVIIRKSSCKYVDLPEM